MGFIEYLEMVIVVAIVLYLITIIGDVVDGLYTKRMRLS